MAREAGTARRKAATVNHGRRDCGPGDGARQPRAVGLLPGPPAHRQDGCAASGKRERMDDAGRVGYCVGATSWVWTLTRRPKRIECHGALAPEIRARRLVVDGAAREGARRSGVD